MNSFRGYRERRIQGLRRATVHAFGGSARHKTGVFRFVNTYIALFKGINVGGHNRLPMKVLRTLMGNLGYRDVQTYIQSGNVVFSSGEKDKQQMSADIRRGVKKDHGFGSEVLILEVDELKAAIASNPFPEAEPDPKSLHLFFLVSSPEDPDLESLEKIKKDSERFRLTGRVFYLHAPEGIGRSKMVEKIGKHISVSMTARNWRTVKMIMEMVDTCSDR